MGCCCSPQARLSAVQKAFELISKSKCIPEDDFLSYRGEGNPNNVFEGKAAQEYNRELLKKADALSTLCKYPEMAEQSEHDWIDTFNDVKRQLHRDSDEKLDIYR